MASSAANILQKQFKELTRNPVPGFAVDLKEDNIFEWDVAIIGSPKTVYEGGYFKATLSFPPDYPFLPPTFRFNTEFYHPNVYADGRLCISILHPPGDDPVSGEKAEERWNPTQSVESILMSIISLLADPNCSSPANVDAGVAYRKDKAAYNAIVRAQVEASKKDIPSGFQMPRTEQDFMVARPTDVQEDADFWYDSGNSDDDEDLAEDDEGSEADDVMDDDEDLDGSSGDEK